MKPKCNTCTKAMKRPYHRTGAEGKWEGIKTWWFCDQCLIMEKNDLFQLPENIRTYLNDVLQPKERPKIQVYSKGLLQVRNEVEKVIEENRKLDTNATWLDVAGIRYNRHYSFEVIWICNTCEATNQVNPEIKNNFLNEKTIEESRPMHCNRPMSLAIINSIENYYRTQTKQLHKTLIENLQADHNKASISFLLLVLLTLYFEGEIAFRSFCHKILRKNREIQQLWGFNFLRLILEELCRRHPVELFIGIPTEELLSRKFNLRNHDYKISNLNSILNDMIEVVRSIDTKTSVKLRSLVLNLIHNFKYNIIHRSIDRESVMVL